MAEFKVGGKVVCVKEYPNSFFRKGMIYTLKDLKVCYCGNVLLDIGFTDNTPEICSKCRYEITDRNIWWVDSDCFLPLDDFKEISFTKINEEVPVSAQ